MKSQLSTSLQPPGPPGPAESKPQAKAFNWVNQVGEEMFNSLTRRPEGIAPGPAEPLRLLSGLKNLTVERKPAANQSGQPCQPPQQVLAVQPVIQPVQTVQVVHPVRNFQRVQGMAGSESEE